jgi:hypothetical protein
MLHLTDLSFRRLYLNTVLSQFGTQIPGILIMNNMNAQPPGHFQVQGPVIDKNAFFWRALRNFQGDTKNGFLRLPRAYVARTEKNFKVPAQIEHVNAVLVKFQRLVVYRSNKIFL